MSILLRKKYDSIKREKLSDTAKKVLKSMYDATNGFKDSTASRKIKTKFDAFYDKLKASKPEAIKGATKPKDTPSSKQFKEARERRKSQAGVPNSERDIKKDAVRPAIDTKGRRVSDGKHYPYKKGNVYYEYRDNRYDKRPAKYPKLEDGGMMKQGYDDREDERLSMEHGKMSMKDLNSTHARRDDAQFEERMADGGMMAKGGEFDTKWDSFREAADNTSKFWNSWDENKRSRFLSERDKEIKYLSRLNKQKYENKWSKNEFDELPNYLQQILESHVYYYEEPNKMADGGVSSYGTREIPYVVVDTDEITVLREFKNYNSAIKFMDEYLQNNSDKMGSLYAMPKESWDKESQKYMKKGGMMAHGGETHRLEQIFANGGEIEEGNLEMVQSNVKAIEHHASELKNLLNNGAPIEAWVVAKLERAETDLSDVTHYIDGLETQEVESDTYFAKGGKVSVKEYKLVPMIPYGVKGYTQPDYKNIVKFEGTEEEAVAKAKELVNSNPTFVQVEIKVEMKTKVLTIGIVEGTNKEYAKGGEVSFKPGMGEKYYDKKIKQSLTIGKESDIEGVYHVTWEDGKDIIYSKKNIDFFIEKGIWKKMDKDEPKKPRAKRTSTLEKLKKGGKLVGNQKKLDVNKNGKLDAQDFKKLREQRKAKK